MSANPFWEYSLELYERPGVAPACIALQDEAGLDVNLLLFCVWSAQAGPGRLSAADLRAAIAATGDWQARVVQPLRAARRAARSAGGSGLFAAAFQRDVAATELSAERVEQWLLLELVAERERAERDAGAALADGCANLREYLRAVGVAPAAVRPRLIPLLAGAFTGVREQELIAALEVNSGQ
jgi:uncharacterized protein (TIGR02444 family)